MDRREFLKTAATAGAALAIGPLAKAAPPAPLVVSVTGPNPAALVADALKALGGMENFVKPGQTVVVKPNIGWDRTPEQAANTNPEVLSEVIRQVLKAGAAKVKVFDRTCNDPRRCYVTSGIAKAVEELGDKRVELSQIDDRKFRQVENPKATMMKNWSYYEEVLTADAFINVPIAKHHASSGLTLAMKNIMGVIGQNRAVLHRNLHEALVDMNQVVRSTLTIIDATRILLANGPQGGRLEDVAKKDTIIASGDVVAADAVATRLFGKSPSDFRFLALAQERGLGTSDLSKINLKEIGSRG